MFSSTTDEYKRQHNVNSSKLDMNTRNGLKVKKEEVGYRDAPASRIITYARLKYFFKHNIKMF